MAPIRCLHTYRVPSHGLGALQENPTHGLASRAQTSSALVAWPPLLLAPCPSYLGPSPSASSRKDAGRGLQAHPQPRVASSPDPSLDCICKHPFPTRFLPQVRGQDMDTSFGGCPSAPHDDCALQQLSPPQTVLCCVGCGRGGKSPIEDCRDDLRGSARLLSPAVVLSLGFTGGALMGQHFSREGNRWADPRPLWRLKT